MIPTKQGYMFSARKCGNTFGVNEEFKVTYKGSLVRVACTFGVDKRGIPLAPAIYRESRFISLFEHLNTNGVDFDYEFDKFMRSRKPTYSMFNNLFFICMLDGLYDKAAGIWVQDKTKLELFMIKGYGEVPNYGFNVFCNVVRPIEGYNTNCVAEPVYLMFRNEILGCMRDCIQSRAEFLANRLGNMT